MTLSSSLVIASDFSRLFGHLSSTSSASSRAFALIAL